MASEETISGHTLVGVGRFGSSWPKVLRPKSDIYTTKKPYVTEQDMLLTLFRKAGLADRVQAGRGHSRAMAQTTNGILVASFRPSSGSRMEEATILKLCPNTTAPGESQSMVRVDPVTLRSRSWIKLRCTLRLGFPSPKLFSRPGSWGFLAFRSPCVWFHM